MRGGDAVRDAPHALEHALARELGDRSHRAEQVRRLGDDVARGAGLDLCDGDHRRIEDVHAAGDERLERLHDLAGDRNRIEAVVRRGGVAAFAAHGDLDRIARREHRPGPRGDDAGRLAVRDVQREGARRRCGAVEQALLQHHARAVVALLARLEHEQHRARQLRAPSRQHARGADQHRHVRVVAARVHRPVDLGRERQARRLAQRQRVHVGPQENRRTRPAARQSRDHRRRALTRARLEPEAIERLQHGRLRARQREADLGMTMDAAPQLDGVGGDALGIGKNLGGLHRSDLRLLNRHAVRGEPHLHLRRGQPQVMDGLVEKMDELVARVVVHGRLVHEQDVGGHSTVTDPEPLRVVLQSELVANEQLQQSLHRHTSPRRYVAPM